MRPVLTSAQPAPASTQRGRAWPTLWLVAAALLAGTGLARADAEVPTDALAVQLLQADARVMLGDSLLATDTGPAQAEADAGTSWARAVVADGTLRGVATLTDGPPAPLTADTGLSMQFQNLSGRTASFATGALHLDLDAAFSRSLPAPGNLGVAANTLVATLGVVILSSAGIERDAGAVSLIYSWTGTPGEPATLRTDQAAAGSLGDAFTIGGLAADADTLRAVLAAPALTLLPGDVLAIHGNVAGSVVATGLLGGSGFSATTHYGNTARLALALPAGFTLQSSQALDWVTTSPVPEPATAALLVAGLLSLGWRLRAARSAHPRR